MKEHKNIKAIRILEFIAEKMGKEKMFDGEMWYDLEDGIMEIINKETEEKQYPKCEGCGEPLLDGQMVIKGENRHSACA